MANPTPVPNLPTISAEEIHANNLTAFRLGNKARYLLNQGLRTLAGTKGLLDQLGCASIWEYAGEYFDFKRSQTYDSIRVAEALDTLPALRAAFQSGRLSWTSVRERCFPPSIPPRGRSPYREARRGGLDRLCARALERRGHRRGATRTG